MVFLNFLYISLVLKHYINLSTSKGDNIMDGFVPTNTLGSMSFDILKLDGIDDPMINVNTLATLDLDYANGKDMKEVQNAYVLLKCWNGNKMPYVIHSNYIDIPETTDNVFIWMRRKKNIFDLKIENLTKGSQ